MRVKRADNLGPRRVNQALELSPRDRLASPLAVLTIADYPTAPLLRSVITLSAQCVDHLGSNQSRLVEWDNHQSPSPRAATGATYRYAVDAPGTHTITARYIDPGGRSVTQVVTFDAVTTL